MLAVVSCGGVGTWRESDRTLSSASASSKACEEEPRPIETEEGGREVAASSRRESTLGHGKDTLRRNWYLFASDLERERERNG